MPQTYSKNNKSAKFYGSEIDSGSEGYNPAITMYYNSSSILVRVEEEWRGETWAQTISGSTWSGSFPSNWSNNIDITKTKVYTPWEKI